MPKVSTMPQRRKRARELLMEGRKKVYIKLTLAEEYGITPRTAVDDYNWAYNQGFQEIRLRHEQINLAAEMFMSGYRFLNIVTSLMERWGKDGENPGLYLLDEEAADEIVQVAVDMVENGTLQTKDEKRQWLSLWFEDKMVNAVKPRDQLRAAALFMRLEGLSDNSDYEAPREDITIELGNWRDDFAKKLDDGTAVSASKVPVQEEEKE